MYGFPANCFVFHALLHYGFETEADALGHDTFQAINTSLDQLGDMRGNFHGETGNALYANLFASWNTLADLMPDYLPGGKPPPPCFFKPKLQGQKYENHKEPTSASFTADSNISVESEDFVRAPAGHDGLCTSSG